MSASRPIRSRTARARRVGVKVCLFACVAMLVGNLGILVVSVLARMTTATEGVKTVAGIDHLEAVDAKLWRGGAPSEAGYRALARAGTSMVVDLRAEEDAELDSAVVRFLGMELVRIPIRDGQAPSAAQVQAFLDATNRGDGLVFVHCGAGVGRTGTMVGAYVVSKGTSNGHRALLRNLAVGPLSLEQLVFVGLLDADRFERPNLVVRAVSRVLDAPRRIWVRLNPFG